MPILHPWFFQLLYSLGSSSVSSLHPNVEFNQRRDELESYLNSISFGTLLQIGGYSAWFLCVCFSQSWISILKALQLQITWCECLFVAQQLCPLVSLRLSFGFYGIILCHPQFCSTWWGACKMEKNLAQWKIVPSCRSQFNHFMQSLISFYFHDSHISGSLLCPFIICIQNLMVVSWQY